jgi:hypothetical protein
VSAQVLPGRLKPELTHAVQHLVHMGWSPVALYHQPHAGQAVCGPGLSQGGAQLPGCRPQAQERGGHSSQPSRAAARVGTCGWQSECLQRGLSQVLKAGWGMSQHVYGSVQHSLGAHTFSRHHTCAQVEKLLAEVAALDTAAAAGGPPADLDTRSRLLERVAGEVSRLMYQANRGKVGGTCCLAVQGV